jgi:secondary thiamine-phosphate synthase enzyme
MKVFNFEISIDTREYLDIIDITDRIVDFVSKSKIKNGLINIQTMHTSASVFLNTNEPLFLEDLKHNIESTSPRDIPYDHDDFKRRTIHMHKDESPNGHSHCKAAHLPTNITVNIINGKIQLGTWQRILFIELDKPKKRTTQIQIIGQ